MRHRKGRLERRIAGEEVVVLAADAQEAAEVAVLAVRGRALALFDDRLDRILGALEIAHLRQPGQHELGWSDLRVDVATEQRRLADVMDEDHKAVADAAIEVPL